jgi:hypothetical protein
MHSTFLQAFFCRLLLSLFPCSVFLARHVQVCSEFYCAAQFGFSALNNTIQQTLQQQLLRQPLPPPPSPYLGDKARQAHNTAAALSTGCNLPGSESWHFWDVLVTDPLSIQITDLEAAARQMGIVDVALPAPPAAAAVSPGAAAHVQAVATAAEASAAGAAAAVATSSNSRNSSSKHRARLISKLLACFGLKQPLPVIATAAAATVPPNDTLQRLAGQNAAAAAAAADTSRATTANATPSSCAAAAAAEPQPCRINGRAALLRAVTLERCCPIIAGDGPDKCAGLLAAVQELSELGYKPAAHAQMYNGLRGCLANVRTELAAAGIGSREALLQLLQQQRDAAAVKRQQQRQQQGRAGLGKRPAGAVVAAALNGAAAKRAKGFSLSSVSIRPKEKQHAFCD